MSFPEDEDKEQTEGNGTISAENIEVDEDPEAQAREYAAANWKQAMNQLRTARLKFDKHEESYDHDLEDYLKAVAEGWCNASRTIFDLMHVTELQELRMEDWKMMQGQDFLKPEAATGDVCSVMPKRHDVPMQSKAGSCTW
jgi:hypothetical protein